MGLLSFQLTRLLKKFSRRSMANQFQAQRDSSNSTGHLMVEALPDHRHPNLLEVSMAKVAVTTKFTLVILNQVWQIRSFYNFSNKYIRQFTKQRSFAIPSQDNPKDTASSSLESKRSQRGLSKRCKAKFSMDAPLKWIMHHRGIEIHSKKIIDLMAVNKTIIWAVWITSTWVTLTNMDFQWVAETCHLQDMEASNSLAFLIQVWWVELIMRHKMDQCLTFLVMAVAKLEIKCLEGTSSKWDTIFLTSHHQTWTLACQTSSLASTSISFQIWWVKCLQI